jgi:hypothetical protein
MYLMTFNRKKFILKAKWGTLIHGECLEFFLQKFFFWFYCCFGPFLAFSALTQNLFRSFPEFFSYFIWN